MIWMIIIIIIFAVSFATQHWLNGIIEQNKSVIRQADFKHYEKIVAEYKQSVLRALKATEFTVGGRTYELLDYTREGEDREITGQIIRKRGERLRASMSRDDGEHIYKHQADIPEDFRNIITFLFPNWRQKDITAELIIEETYKRHPGLIGDKSVKMYWASAYTSLFKSVDGWLVIGGLQKTCHKDYYDNVHIIPKRSCLVRYKPSAPQEEHLKRISIDGFIYKLRTVMEPLDDLSIHGKTMRARGESFHASMSTEDGEFIYKKRDQIPTDCRDVNFVFPDWSDSTERITYLTWNGSQWVKRYGSLNSNEWDDSFCFLLYERRAD